jgi:hypothetical protein
MQVLSRRCAVAKSYLLYVCQYWSLVSQKHFRFDDGYQWSEPSVWHYLFSTG